MLEKEKHDLVEDIMKELDTDHNNKISKKEFDTWVTSEVENMKV